MEIAEPDWDTLNRLRNEFLNASGNVGLYWNSITDLVQYHQYFAARIGWKWDAAIAQARQVGWGLESSTILDWGCGTGIATLRILEAFGSENVNEVVLWDHSSAATSFAQTMLLEKYPDLKVTLADNLSNLDLSNTLSLASHVLNELSLSDRESLTDLFSKSRQIFWVEPGSYDSSRLLLEQREGLRELFHPVAPCICAISCPMNLEENKNHWCHFFAKPPIVAFTESRWAQFAKMMEIDLRSLPYSFLVMDSKKILSRSDLLNKSRLLGRPRQYKGYTRIYSCDQNGHNDYELWKREDKSLWKTIKKNKSGTLFEWTQIESGKILAGKAVEGNLDQPNLEQVFLRRAGARATPRTQITTNLNYSIILQPTRSNECIQENNPLSPMTHPKRSLVIIAAATLLSLSAFGSSKIVRPIEQSINLDGVVKVEVHIQGGFINLKGDPRSDAHVLIEKVFRNTSEKEADSIESKIEQTIEVRDDVLYIEFKYDNDWDFWSLFKSKPSVNFNATLSVPKSIDVNLHTSGGHIEIDGVEGEVAARTSGGHMQLTNIGGSVNAHTSGGSITASNLRSEADLSTSGGRIKVDSIAGNSKLKTSGGSISATGVNGPLEAKTSGGSITATFPRGIDDDTVLKTSGGGITAKLPQGERFYLNARTSGGGVRTDFPITMTGELKRSQAEGAVNGGGPLLELRTSGGNINVGYLKDQT